MKKHLKVFVSTPMNGLDSLEILKTQEKTFDGFVNFIKKSGPEFMDCTYSLIGTAIREAPGFKFENDTERRLWYLGGSIQMLGTADMVVFTEGYINAPGCLSENYIAHQYNIPVFYEKDGGYGTSE